jgi:exo-beta-1,3-glucanase (GH17 family)
MLRLVVLFFVTAGAIAAVWWGLGRPVPAPAAAADPGRIQCTSYAPFRADQSPLVAGTQARAAEIEEDLAKLSRVTGCVRTYATDNGLDQVPAIAQRHGIKVLQGLWLGHDRARNRVQIDTAVALAKRYPDVIIGVVVGNEVLLRGELAAEDIAGALHEVKAAVTMPVTYADVWEFWLRNRELAAAVDFVTIHILPYWEDFPIPADLAAAHVDEIHDRAAAAFPGKDILIGEVGWPSEGRMREGALPSPSNQARVLEEVMARSKAKNYRVNLIEAFDQPWKRFSEGTVGGYWGLFGSMVREPKFVWAEPVSDHPLWRLQLALGVVLAAAVFGAAAWARRAASRPAGKAVQMPGDKVPDGGLQDERVLAGIAVIALAAGITAPWGLANVAIESLGIGGWIRGAAFAAVALTAPVAASMALAGGFAMPSFAQVWGAVSRPHSPIARGGGVLLVATTVLALQTALGLVFDPRYREFEYAQLTAGVVPFAACVLFGAGGRERPANGRRGRAEIVAAVTLAGSAVYIVLNESFANWQAIWLSVMLVVLAMTLDRVRG